MFELNANSSVFFLLFHHRIEELVIIINILRSKVYFGVVCEISTCVFACQRDSRRAAILMYMHTRYQALSWANREIVEIVI